jgi:hypothetical protein
LAQGGEHKMLFDIQGRRKRLVQVVYAMLAFIMAASLFFVVGPVDLGSLVGGGTTGSSSAAFDDEAQQIEQKLAKDPRNEQLLVRDVRARYTAGNVQIEHDPNTGAITSFPEGASEDFNKASDAWLRYLKLDPQQPDANVAQLAATALLYSAASSTAVDFNPKIKGAAAAQAIYAEAQPSLNSYLTLAQYEFLAGDSEAGDAAGRKAAQEASAVQRRAVTQTVTQYRKAGEQLQKRLKAATKFKPSGGGQQALENPLGGLSGGGGGSGLPAPAP